MTVKKESFLEMNFCKQPLDITIIIRCFYSATNRFLRFHSKELYVGECTWHPDIFVKSKNILLHWDWSMTIPGQIQIVYLTVLTPRIPGVILIVYLTILTTRILGVMFEVVQIEKCESSRNPWTMRNYLQFSSVHLSYLIAEQTTKISLLPVRQSSTVKSIR